MTVLQKDIHSTNLEGLTRKELLELAGITERWASKKDHRFYLYEPNPIMHPFHKSQAKTRVLLGGNRSGKTEALILDLAMQFLGEVPISLEGRVPEHRINPQRRIRLNMIDYPNSFEKIIWEKIKNRIPSDKIETVLREQGRVKAIVNSHGGFIEFMQYEQDVKKFQGTSRHVCAYDEEPPQSIRDENLVRLIDTDGEEVFSMTPISEESSSGYMPTLWIYDELYLKSGKYFELVNGVLNTKTNTGSPLDIETFIASIYDNKALSHEAINRILSTFKKDEREARAFGHFMFLSGLIYSNYNETHHLIPSFSDWWMSPDYTLYLAIDPHPRTPHAVLFLAVRKDHTIFIVDELYSQFPDSKSFVQAIKSKCMGKIPEVILMEQAAYTRDPSTGRCFAYDLMDEGLYPHPLPASKDLSRGIIATKKVFELSELTNMPYIYITDNCVRFRYEILHYRWSNWSKNTGMAKEVKQKPVDKDDHMMENLYRLILFNPSYIQQIDEEEITKEFISKTENIYTGY